MNMTRATSNTRTGQVYRRPHIWMTGWVLAVGVISFVVGRPLLLVAFRPPQPMLYLVAEIVFGLLEWGWIAILCLVVANLCGSLEISANGITMQFLGWYTTTPWSNVRRIANDEAAKGNAPRLVLHQPVTARPTRIVRNARPPVVREIPLHAFTRDWPNSRLRRDLQQYLPKFIAPTN